MIRCAVWVLAAIWVVGVTVLFGNVDADLRPPLTALAVAWGMGVAVGVLLAGFVHWRPDLPRIIALTIAVPVSLLWTWRDTLWLQGEGRNDGQAGLLWFDPVVLLPLSFVGCLAVARAAVALRLWLLKRKDTS